MWKNNLNIIFAFIKSIHTGGVTTAVTTSSEVTIAPKNLERDHNQKRWRGDNTHRVEGPPRGGPSARQYWHIRKWVCQHFGL